ncbi:hypothetical protein EYF80_022186 [Liparis tanakae]|uniref:Uncharacterized protein n=1 Tax=Liparis tanakae TaxID=230148 RepID=A0A4Z2HPB4_9TELE|nr:hypothetical protein EYF80_022186 [Liparis tanakae]
MRTVDVFFFSLTEEQQAAYTPASELCGERDGEPRSVNATRRDRNDMLLASGEESCLNRTREGVLEPQERSHIRPEPPPLTCTFFLRPYDSIHLSYYLHGFTTTTITNTHLIHTLMHTHHLWIGYSSSDAAVCIIRWDRISSSGRCAGPRSGHAPSQRCGRCDSRRRGSSCRRTGGSPSRRRAARSA